MSFNKSYELKKFEAHWEKLRIEYAAAGMTEDTIQKMYDYDRQQFNSERTFIERTQEFTAPAYESSEEEASPLMLRYQEAITTTDTYHETKSKFAWIGEIENERLLSALENLSEDYKGELKFLSKKIRKDFWNTDYNTEKLAKLLHIINGTYEMVFNCIGYFDLSCIIEYVKLLAKYCCVICPDLNADYYNQLIDDIQMENARIIIEEQWKDITASEDGLKSFKEIFDDVFTKCLNGNRDKFFHKLKDTDVLCRVVDDKLPINRERFIPFDKSYAYNRWNPPGKSFLYLSFGEEEKEYSSELRLSEYICLEEYRAKKGNKYYFCNFKPVNEGVIFDLSYNDVSLRKIKNMLDEYEDTMASQMIEEIMKEPDAVKKYQNKKKLKKKVKKLQLKYQVDKGIIEESIAKQYLKMICNCIYKKVDETDDEKKEIAYKSFWALATYLKEQGVTGIIYPCTRTNKVVGKNLVLFNKNDAEPIESTIREFNY